MRGGVKEIGIVPENILRAVAVMHVEIDHRDALEPMRVTQMQCADRDVVEEAKAHRALALGMMAGRAHGAKGVRHLALP